MGVKCLFELWVIPESQEQSYLSRSGNILHELAGGLEELLHRDPLSVASTCLSLSEGWSGPWALLGTLYCMFILWLAPARSRRFHPLCKDSPSLSGTKAACRSLTLYPLLQSFHLPAPSSWEGGGIQGVDHIPENLQLKGCSSVVFSVCAELCSHWSQPWNIFPLLQGTVCSWVSFPIVLPLRPSARQPLLYLWFNLPIVSIFMNGIISRWPL